MKPLVIFLNGPTGVGKSSISKILQARLLPLPFMYLGIDLIIDMMPAGMNDWLGGKSSDGFWWKIDTDLMGNKIAHIQVGPYAAKVCESLQDIALTLLKKGHNLIIDEVCLRTDSFASWRQKLAPYKTLYVGLSAPLDVLELREAQRGDRMVGSARAQYPLVHEGNTYDLNLDTSLFSSEDCAEKIIAAMSA